MKKLRGSLFAKICAIFLSALLTLAFLASVAGVVVLAFFGAYPNGYRQAEERALGAIGSGWCYEAGDRFLCGIEGDAIYPGTNFRFRVSDGEGKILYNNYQGEECLWQDSVVIEPGYAVTIAPAEVSAAEEDSQGTKTNEGADSAAGMPAVYDSDEAFLVSGYILADMEEQDEILFSMQLLRWAYEARYALIVIAAATLLLWIMIFVFLMCAAGHRDGTDEVKANAIDRTPFDLFLLAMGSAFTVVLAFAFNMGPSEAALMILFGGLAFLLAELIGISFFMSLATRLKLGGIIKSCVIYKILRWCWRLVRNVWRWTAGLVKALPLLGRWGAALGGLLLVEFIFILSTEYENGMEIFGWLLERAALLALLLYFVSCARRLRQGAREIAGGNEAYKIDTKDMRGELLRHAEDLNNIGEGISRAVDERMKSEHFRTELITNVSHDIKTPLTSIINYVDLLSKEKPENEKMREYIDVLSRQSARMKKLIDDLIEASKASTGNLSVNLERCELGVLLEQTAGEYGEKLGKAGLTLVLTKPEEAVTVMADGRHMWRVFDNLMNNACKYAQPGTRVYLSLEKRENRALVIFRNISRSQLNISGDELMERFVRGDSSRNTEGSGLGLSIARSLVQLQNGQMELSVDGDLFKVILSFCTVQ